MDKRNLRKTRVGIVSSDKMDKTVLSILFTKRLLTVPLSSKRTMKTTSAESVTAYLLWKPVLFQKTRDGVL